MRDVTVTAAGGKTLARESGNAALRKERWRRSSYRSGGLAAGHRREKGAVFAKKCPPESVFRHFLIFLRAVPG
jgi:hypothetical protein